ncbi:HAUS augmin-like complex subunit 4 [Balamuthia mandrillaris]
MDEGASNNGVAERRYDNMSEQEEEGANEQRAALPSVGLPLAAPTLPPNCPQFRQLLQKLARGYLNKDGVTLEKAERLEKAKAALNREKERYVQNLLLWQTLKDILLENKARAFQSAPPKQLRVFEALNRTLVAGEVSSVGQRGGPVLGVCKDDLKEHLQQTCSINLSTDEKQRYKFSRFIVPLLETELRKRCTQLATYYQLDKDQGEESHQSQEAVSLHLIVGRDMADLLAHKQRLGAQQTEVEKLFWKYYKVLQKTLAVLVQLIDHHRNKQAFAQSEVTGKWLQASCKTMLLKLSVLKNQILLDTYSSKERISALSFIRDRLNEELTASTLRLDQAAAQKRRYEGVGFGFKRLVLEYANLSQALADKEWALAQLKESS